MRPHMHDIGKERRNYIIGLDHSHVMAVSQKQLARSSLRSDRLIANNGLDVARRALFTLEPTFGKTLKVRPRLSGITARNGL